MRKITHKKKEFSENPIQNIKSIYNKHKNSPALQGISFEEFSFQMGKGPVVEDFDETPTHLYQFIPEAVEFKLTSDNAIIEANKTVKPIEDPDWVCKNKKRKCDSHSYYHATVSTRSGDEGMTHFATCAKCGQRQKT